MDFEDDKLMSVTITKQTQTGGGVWSLAWASDIPNATFYVYKNGILSYSTKTNSGSFMASQGGRLLIEILDDINLKPTEVYSGVVRIGWYMTEETKSYLIEKLSGASWVKVGSIIDIGIWWYNWTSDVLNDCESYSFRVTPVGLNGNHGQPIVFVGFMVRNPDEPNLSVVMNNDTSITFHEI